jgi:hypothetical protein
LVDLIIRIKPFRLVFGSITDRDNEGKVRGGSIIDRDNQASFSLIIPKFQLDYHEHDNQAFSCLISSPWTIRPGGDCDLTLIITNMILPKTSLKGLILKKIRTLEGFGRIRFQILGQGVSSGKRQHLRGHHYALFQGEAQTQGECSAQVGQEFYAKKKSFELLSFGLLIQSEGKFSQRERKGKVPAKAKRSIEGRKKEKIASEMLETQELCPNEVLNL